MTKAKGMEIGKWVGTIVGLLAIFGGLARGIGIIYAEDKRIGDVETTTAMMPCLLWDLQILKADARSRNPNRYDSIVENQVKISGPRPAIEGRD